MGVVNADKPAQKFEQTRILLGGLLGQSIGRPKAEWLDSNEQEVVDYQFHHGVRYVVLVC